VIRIRPMTAADVALGMRLKEEAGWNQTQADWQRFLALEPDGCFVAELDGMSVGTTTTCVFAPVGWIAMVLVDERVRGRGVGSGLMRHALRYLDKQGVRTARLDATPLGQPVYGKLGFVPDYALVRFEGVLPARDPVSLVEPVRPENLDRIHKLDQTITQTDRRKLMTHLYGECPERFRWVRRGQECLGFLTSRPGTTAVHLGPCGAGEEAASLLLADACHAYHGQRVYVDVPVENGPATSLAESLGLKPQRRLLRMHRGPALAEQIPMLCASSGPEMG
jgi:GNAT superfamily N-acetyltransferase